MGALATASGQSAITLALLNIARAGDEIVAADNLYGGTYNLLHYTFPRLGIKVHFVPSEDLAALDKAITPKTKAVYAESIGNPKLDVADLDEISKIAHEHGVPLVLDNTVSPYLLRPFERGVVKGGAAAGARFIDSLSLISHVANVGAAKTLAIHPATSTHQQLSAEEQKRTGVIPDYVRLSVGIEHIDDILADVGQALEKA